MAMKNEDVMQNNVKLNHATIAIVSLNKKSKSIMHYVHYARRQRSEKKDFFRLKPSSAQMASCIWTATIKKN